MSSSKNPNVSGKRGRARSYSRGRSNNPKPALQKHRYHIEHMDALGQGVCKQNGAITFIAKTLPGESGVARIHKRSKGVQFAISETVDHLSSQRIEPECTHFQKCPGCHYLHTDYNTELDYKRDALLKIMQPFLMQSISSSGSLSEDVISVIAAPERLSYRNRIQLHYRHKYIGLVDASTDQVIEIPDCKIIRPELQDDFDALYTDKVWTKHHEGKGHFELYLDKSDVKKTWNSDYAEGGFTQVNDAMNKVLKKIVREGIVDNKSIPNGLLDLFSGDGNLSDDVFLNSKTAAPPRVMVDITPSDHVDYFQIDLFDDDALKRFKNLSSVTQFGRILIDPPRKGFPALGEWVKSCRPKQLIYVSCNAATMARDLQQIEGKFTIDKMILVDLFPSTYHFETVVFLSFK